MSNKDKTARKTESSATASVSPDEFDGAELKEFRVKVNKWCELDNKIKQFEQVVKAHKQMKDELCGDILDFMGDYDISNLTTPFGKLQMVESVTKVPITKTLIEDKVNTYFNKLGVKNSKEQSESLVKDLYDNREKKTSMRLRRIAPRVAKEPKQPKEPKKPKQAKDETSRKSNIPEGLKKI
jgi:hypothetical protein